MPKSTIGPAVKREHLSVSLAVHPAEVPETLPGVEPIPYFFLTTEMEMDRKKLKRE